MFELPSGVLQSVLDNAQEVISGISAWWILVFGVVFTFFVLDFVIIPLVERRIIAARERRVEEEEELKAASKVFKRKLGKLSPSERQAVLLRRRFLEVEKGEGISTSTQ